MTKMSERMERSPSLAGSASSFIANAQSPLYPSLALPIVHRRRFGSIEVTSLCDGYTGFEQEWVTNIKPEAWADVANRAFLPPGPVPTAVNAFAISVADKIVLIDAGAGRFWDPKNCGRLPAALRFAGILPEQVDAIAITHLHADHAGGLLTQEDTNARFPNAQLFVPEGEASYWLDPHARSRAPEHARAGFDRAATWLAAYAGRTTRFTAHSQLLPGLQAMPLPGHTPGHTGYLIGDGAERLLIVGDLVQVFPFQLFNPAVGTVLDVDSQAATETRRHVLDMASFDRVMIAGSHLPFPGLGFVAQFRAGYEFVPAPWPIGI